MKITTQMWDDIRHIATKNGFSVDHLTKEDLEIYLDAETHRRNIRPPPNTLQMADMVTRFVTKRTRT